MLLFLIMFNKTFFQENNYRLLITLMSESANNSFASFVFLFFLVKFVMVGYTRRLSFEKNAANLNTKGFVSSPSDNSAGVA